MIYRKIRIGSWFFAIITLCVLLACDGGGGGNGNGDNNPPIAPEPPVADALQGVQFFEGWTDPRKLAEPINTAGWEDSAFISYDGYMLYFAYTPLDYYEFTQGNAVVVGPTGAPQRPDQHGESFDIYEALNQSGSWVTENSSANSQDPLIHEAAIGVNNDESTMAFVRFDPEGDIYLANRQQDDTWVSPELLPSPINTQCVEDNPHLSADGMMIYFDSNRDDINGTDCLDESGGLQRSIYLGNYDGSTWSNPTKIQGIPNQSPYAWQVFVKQDGEYIYFSGTCTGGNACLFRARKLSDGSYGEETVIAQSTTISPTPGDVMAVGEMSITGDDEFLYFVYIQYNAATDLELGIAVARKQ
jgi:hypothetical protein